MSDMKKELSEALIQAIKAERDGHSFYTMAAKGTDDPKGREIFETLALEELDHMNFLRAQYDAILKTGKPDTKIKLGPRAELDTISPIFSEKIKNRISEAHIEMSALSIGIQLELDATKFYEDQAQAASDPDIKSFFEELAQWENGHYRALLAQQEEFKADYWSQGGFAPF